MTPLILDIEVLDVSEDEARVLLLSIDPLASLAGVQEQLRDRLETVAPLMPEELRLAWQAAAGGARRGGAGAAEGARCGVGGAVLCVDSVSG